MGAGKKILLTGGTGFIGSQIAERLVALNNTPTLIVRKKSDRERLDPIAKDIELISGDLLDREGLAKVVASVRPDIIFHLASTGVYSYTNTDPVHVADLLKNNIEGTIHLLHAAKRVGFELFINTGSCFEYGDSNVPFKESDPLHPLNSYGISKVATTLFADVFGKEHNLPIVSLRPFTVYGPGQDEGRFIATVIKQCLLGENPNLPKETIVRDYIFIDDVVDAYLLVAEYPHRVRGQILNVSTGKATTLVDAVKLIANLAGAKNIRPNIGGFPIREGEVRALVGNPTKIKKLLEWKARYSLEEGLKKTISWVKKEHH